MNEPNLQLNGRLDILLTIDLHRANLGANMKLDPSGMSINPAAASKFLCFAISERNLDFHHFNAEIPVPLRYLSVNLK